MNRGLYWSSHHIFRFFKVNYILSFLLAHTNYILHVIFLDRLLNCLGFWTCFNLTKVILVLIIICHGSVILRYVFTQSLLLWCSIHFIIMTLGEWSLFFNLNIDILRLNLLALRPWLNLRWAKLTKLMSLRLNCFWTSFIHKA